MNSKRAKKVGMIVGGIIIVVVTGLVIAFNIMINQMMSGGGAIDKMIEAGVPFDQEFVPYGEYSINTFKIGDPSLPKVLFVHGSPGHWFDFVNIYTNTDLLDNYCMIAYDRPGYGMTTMPPAKEMSMQADVAAAVMEYFCDDDECYQVAGHSYGGGVTEQLLLDHAYHTNKGIYVAGTLSPDHQPRKWYNYLASMWMVRAMIPKDMRSSNHEMMTLSAELEKNRGQQSRITQPIVLIQGTKDVLVPYATVDYYKSVKPSGVNYVIVEGMNHFIPWTNPELIVDAILAD